MIEKVSLKGTTYSHLPYKFEAGTPMIAEVIALGSALDYINQIGSALSMSGKAGYSPMPQSA